VDPEIDIRPAVTQVDDLLSEVKIRALKKERVLVTTLTKRMSEDLTEYMMEQGVKVRYLHSDIDTVERMEIIRDLRLGVFDVLIGINLLREGLDIPEVSLVAILDADKEGFLRSHRSLIQTMGRAARHIDGHVILYADKITDSMKSAMAETERRRVKQRAHNLEHGITPQGIKKHIHDVMDQDAEGSNNNSVRDSQGNYQVALSADDIAKKIKILEKQMFEHARGLAFEEAAKTRDEIVQLERMFCRITE